MGKRHGKGPGNPRVKRLTAAITPRTTRKYEYNMGANCWKDVWAEEHEVSEATSKANGGAHDISVQIYHDAQKKLPFRKVHPRTLRLAY